MVFTLYRSLFIYFYLLYFFGPYTVHGCILSGATAQASRTLKGVAGPSGLEKVKINVVVKKYMHKLCCLNLMNACLSEPKGLVLHPFWQLQWRV